MISTMELLLARPRPRAGAELRRGWTYPKVTKDWNSQALGEAGAAGRRCGAMRYRLPGLAAEKLPKFGVEAMWVYHPLVSPRLARICKLRRGRADRLDGRRRDADAQAGRRRASTASAPTTRACSRGSEPERRNLSAPSGSERALDQEVRAALLSRRAGVGRLGGAAAQTGAGLSRPDRRRPEPA